MEWVLLSGLTDVEQREVTQLTVVRRYERGEILFHAGDPADTLHFLAAGRVAIQATTASGDTATYTILGPGQAFGELALLSPNAHRSSTVVALEPVETRVLRRDQFEAIRRLHPGIDRLLIELLSQQVRRLSADLLEALYLPIEQRVVRRLLVLCREYGGYEVGPVSVPLTQTDLAELAGATRPTVNKVLRGLEAAGLLRLSRGRIEVLDRPGLRPHAR